MDDAVTVPPSFRKSMCVAIASHISNEKRIGFLIECLISLMRQTCPVAMYLSISFSTDQLRELFTKTIFNKIFLKIDVNGGDRPWMCGLHQYPMVSNNKLLTIFMQEKKTPQMCHIELLYPEIGKRNHEWVLFSDDDDTYEPNRVETFAKSIMANRNQSNDSLGREYAGAYESINGTKHLDKRHEYWAYCVKLSIVKEFFVKLRSTPDHSGILENQCCDILFAEYLRRSENLYTYTPMPENLYNYRKQNNDDSITGTILNSCNKTIRRANPPPENDPMFANYIRDWNFYLHENLDIYLHDIFLLTTCGMQLERILQSEFQADYPYLNRVDFQHVDKLSNHYTKIQRICNELYGIKLDSTRWNHPKGQPGQ